MKRILIVASAVGAVVVAYSCGAGGGSVPDAARVSASWAAVVALCVGVGLGGAYARAVRARRDWQSARTGMRAMRRLTVSTTGVTLRWVLVAAAIAAAAVTAVTR